MSPLHLHALIGSALLFSFFFCFHHHAEYVYLELALLAISSFLFWSLFSDARTERQGCSFVEGCSFVGGYELGYVVS